MSFWYKDGDDLVLRDVSLSLQPGEKIGIVGRTGAGKSSLTMALFRINELASGHILIDGVDISTLGLQTLRGSLSVITQAPMLFKGSVRGYLDPFDEYTGENLWLTLRKAGLSENVAAMNGLLYAALEENGKNFSVGKRQILCMARALLSELRVVVMDETTAAIDHEMDLKLQHVIREEFRSSTVITIAHRLDTVLDGDRVVEESATALIDETAEMLAETPVNPIEDINTQSSNDWGGWWRPTRSPNYSAHATRK